MQNPRLVIPLELTNLQKAMSPGQELRGGTPVGGMTPGGFKKVIGHDGKVYYVPPGGVSPQAAQQQPPGQQPGAQQPQPGQQKPGPQQPTGAQGIQGAQAAGFKVGAAGGRGGAPGQPQPTGAVSDQPQQPQAQPQGAQVPGVPPEHAEAHQQALAHAQKHPDGMAGEPTSPGDAITSEPTVPPDHGLEPYNPDPNPPEGGVSESSRVGVKAREVPPPPQVPRLPNLTSEERAVESAFANAFERDPGGLVADYRKRLAAGEIGDAPNVFATDDAKMLSPDYNPADASDDEVKDRRARFNTMVHQTANAIVKRAFVEQLDELAKLPDGDPKRQVLVTSGGVAAGKGYALGNVEKVKAISAAVGAVWDAAGEQNATENPWVLEECEKRGLKPVFVFVDADPEVTWADKSRGVIERAGKKGRMVDARLFADSYTIGARNFKSFFDQNKSKANVTFHILDNRGKPRMLDDIPPETLTRTSEDLYAFASKIIDGYQGLKPAVRRGASVGRRIWGPAGQGGVPLTQGGPGAAPGQAGPVAGQGAGAGPGGVQQRV